MNKHWSPYEKYRQVRKEAKATGGLLVLLILFWCFAGFGLSGVDVEMFGLPLWAVMLGESRCSFWMVSSELSTRRKKPA